MYYISKLDYIDQQIVEITDTEDGVAEFVKVSDISAENHVVGFSTKKLISVKPIDNGKHAYYYGTHISDIGFNDLILYVRLGVYISEFREDYPDVDNIEDYGVLFYTIDGVRYMSIVSEESYEGDYLLYAHVLTNKDKLEQKVNTQVKGRRTLSVIPVLEITGEHYYDYVTDDFCENVNTFGRNYVLHDLFDTELYNCSVYGRNTDARFIKRKGIIGFSLIGTLGEQQEYDDFLIKISEPLKEIMTFLSSSNKNACVMLYLRGSWMYKVATRINLLNTKIPCRLSKEGGYAFNYIEILEFFNEISNTIDFFKKYSELLIDNQLKARVDFLLEHINPIIKCLDIPSKSDTIEVRYDYDGMYIYEPEFAVKYSLLNNLCNLEREKLLKSHNAKAKLTNSDCVDDLYGSTIHIIGDDTQGIKDTYNLITFKDYTSVMVSDSENWTMPYKLQTVFFTPPKVQVVIYNSYDGYAIEECCTLYSQATEEQDIEKIAIAYLSIPNACDEMENDNYAFYTKRIEDVFMENRATGITREVYNQWGIYSFDEHDYFSNMCSKIKFTTEKATRYFLNYIVTFVAEHGIIMHKCNKSYRFKVEDIESISEKILCVEPEVLENTLNRLFVDHEDMLIEIAKERGY